VGRGGVEACSALGADIVLGARNPSDVEDLIREIKSSGRRAMAVAINLPDIAAARRSVAEAHAAMGRIDVLVNNVGIGPENLAENVTEPDFDLTLDVNLKGTFFVTQAVAKLMKED